ncbi:hypothetical protein CALCODRAFT_501054 [Calocera cornea HHB12733]|uniref:Amino acid transporter transmembrane domain-containing protein n=1 Tax=Calocera cornea HHB12733 TaxID=1353952 RepID=A0A165DTU3_9BASI|nr:hypothetical protein CALCODRAFT_501054 [Calocera cornea HHB12733]
MSPPTNLPSRPPTPPPPTTATTTATATQHKSNLTRQLLMSQSSPRSSAQGTPPDHTALAIPGTGDRSSPQPRRASHSTASPPVPNIPNPRYGSPAAGLSQSYGARSLAERRVSRGQHSGQSTPRGGEEDEDRAKAVEDMPKEKKAEIVRRHLVSREEREGGASTPSRRPSEAGTGYGTLDRFLSRGDSGAATPSPAAADETEPFPIQFDNEGSDITHGIYRWQSEARNALKRPRSASFSNPRRADLPDPALHHIHQPNGMRRAYLAAKANARGEEQPAMVNNFIDFLLLFGHFAGEDLDEIEEEDEEDLTIRASAEDAVRESLLRGGSVEDGLEYIVPEGAIPPSKTTERTRLLRAHSLTRGGRGRSQSIVRAGDATVTQAVLMLLKSFVGTGILFLGKAFFNGGILFSSFVLCFIALISLHSFLLLVKTRFVIPGGFGEMGGVLYGRWMRLLILGSIVLSQLGFVSAYLIFVAENLKAFVLAVTNCKTDVPIQYLIFSELVLFVPLSLIRNLAKLSTTALVADAFILVGLVYIFGNEISSIAHNGMAHVELFNPKDFPLLVGTAVFSFEGIGLVIPITESMREPRKFPRVLSGVMIFLMFLFGGGGALAYAAYGKDIQTVVIINLPQDQKFVQVVQFIYALAILLSAPLQLFPALRIMENGLFTRSGKADPGVKWMKNGFRLCIVLLCTMVSWAGAADLDKFVSLIGCFACVPLCYVYPAMLHLKAVAKTRTERLTDWLLIVFGILAAGYTTFQTVKLMMGPSGGTEFGHCSPTDGL